MKRLDPAGLAFGLLLASACSSVPPEEPLLVSNIQLERQVSLRESHEDFVRRYYDALERDIERFIDEEWTPAFLELHLATPEERADLRQLMDLMLVDVDDLMAAVLEDTQWAEPLERAVNDALTRTKAESQMAFTRGVLEVAERGLAEIDAQRDEMLSAVRDQRDAVLRELSEIYAAEAAEHRELRTLLGSVALTEVDRVRDASRRGTLEGHVQDLDQLRRSGERAQEALATVIETPEQMDAVSRAFLDAFHSGTASSSSSSASEPAAASDDTQGDTAGDDSSAEEAPAEEAPAEPAGEGDDGAGGDSPGA